MGRARLGLLAFASVVGVAALLQQMALSRAHASLGAVLRDHGVDRRRPNALVELRREPDAGERRLVVATSVLADLLERATPRESDPADFRAARVAEAQEAMRLAKEALDMSPLSWRAQLLLGAATYLDRSLRRDDRLITAARDWEAPLEHAWKFAPSESDSQRFLTMAYLEIWPMLSPEKRTLTRQLLAVAFSDPLTFERFVDPWLIVAGNGPDALDVLPDELFVWDSLRRRFSQSGSLASLAYCHRRLLQASDRQFEADLAEGIARLKGGDFRRGRDRLLSLAVLVPPDLRWLSIFVQTVERLPPGPVRQSVASTLTRWLDWNLERCLYDRCALPERVQQRLTQWVGPTDPVARARAQLASSELVLAERNEPLEPVPAAWSPYFLQKAAVELERGSAAKAARALRLVGPPWTTSTLYEARKEQLARADPSGAPRLLADLPSAADTGRRAAWAARDWQRDRRLVLWPSAPGSGLELDFSRLAISDVVEVVWDGGAIGAFVVGPARSRITLVVDVSLELHVLEVRFLSGQRPPLPDVRVLRP